MTSLESIELNFLLALINFDGYRSKITEVEPSSSTSASDRDKACESLISKGFVECSREISKFVIDKPGQAILDSDIDSLPVKPIPQELKVLKACVKEITPGKLRKIPANERQSLLRNLANRELIKISEEPIKEVWLSAQGKQRLQNEYTPSIQYLPAENWSIHAMKLGSYLKFLRENFSQPSVRQKLPTSQPSAQQPLSQPGNQPNSAMPIGSKSKLDAQAVLQQIKQLDQLMGTDNYLPIYHLREKLQPPMTREEVDSRLYELQRNDRVELSSLHDKGDYSDRQISAGISQNHGRSLFFISVL